MDAAFHQTESTSTEPLLTAPFESEPLTAAPQPTVPSIGDWLTFERLVYGTILFIGGFIRFFGLGAQPLSDGEAATSFVAWTAALGLESRPGILELSDALPPTSSLLYSLQGMLFWVAGGTDSLARFWPALAGVALVLLPWFVRHQIGRYTAMALALLFAIDPWLGAYSRLADGTSLTALFGMAVLCGLTILHHDDRSPDIDSPDADNPDADNPDADNSYERRSMGAVSNAVWLSAGLLLISGPQAWSFVIVIALFGLLYGVPSRLFPSYVERDTEPLDNEEIQLPEDDELTGTVDTSESPTAEAPTDELPTTELPTTELPTTESPSAGFPVGIWLFIGAVLIGSTGWLAFPEGLSYIGTSISQWVEQLVGISDAEAEASAMDGYSLGWLLLRLLTDQFLLLLLGIVGLITLWRSQPSNELADDDFDAQRAPLPLLGPQFLTIWLLVGLLLSALPGRGPLSLLMIELPLLLATAALLGSLAEAFFSEVQQRGSDSLHADARYVDPMPWQEIRFVVFGLSGLLVLMGFVTASMIEGSVLSSTLLLTALLVFAIFIMLGVILVLVTGWQTGIRVLGLYLGVLLCVVGISNSWHLNQRVEPLQPDAFFEQVTSSDVRTLVTDIRTLSSQRIGDPEEIPVRVAMRTHPDPVLAWNLRNMRNLSWTHSPTDAAEQGPQVLITFDEEVTSQAVSDSYLGSDYSLSQRWLPDTLLNYEANAETEAELSLLERIEQRWSNQYQPLARWIYYRKVTQVPPAEKVVLWTKGL